MLTVCPLCHHLALPWQRTAMTSVGRVHLACSPWTERKVSPPLRTLFLRDPQLRVDHHRTREMWSDRIGVE